eukprot:TRINITY_DN1266_c1_g1_i3.p1 TRINITY_DN1266_c1_g1~~TRINITY_DN1266_c1_g1_i3.p1  ORF type:complete len:2657 (+),score=609.48 TRINITY_DN1266_c1_g1_i3:163-8133(+)
MQQAKLVELSTAQQKITRQLEVLKEQIKQKTAEITEDANANSTTVTTRPNARASTSNVVLSLSTDVQKRIMMHQERDALMKYLNETVCDDEGPLEPSLVEERRDVTSASQVSQQSESSDSRRPADSRGSTVTEGLDTVSEVPTSSQAQRRKKLPGRRGEQDVEPTINQADVESLAMEVTLAENRVAELQVGASKCAADCNVKAKDCGLPEACTVDRDKLQAWFHLHPQRPFLEIFTKGLQTLKGKVDPKHEVSRELTFSLDKMAKAISAEESARAQWFSEKRKYFNNTALNAAIEKCLQELVDVLGRVTACGSACASGSMIRGTNVPKAKLEPPPPTIVPAANASQDAKIAAASGAGSQTAPAIATAPASAAAGGGDSAGSVAAAATAPASAADRGGDAAGIAGASAAKATKGMSAAAAAVKASMARAKAAAQAGPGASAAAATTEAKEASPAAAARRRISSAADLAAELGASEMDPAASELAEELVDMEVHVSLASEIAGEQQKIDDLRKRIKELKAQMGFSTRSAYATNECSHQSGSEGGESASSDDGRGGGADARRPSRKSRAGSQDVKVGFEAGDVNVPRKNSSDGVQGEESADKPAVVRPMSAALNRRQSKKLAKQDQEFEMLLKRSERQHAQLKRKRANKLQALRKVLERAGHAEDVQRLGDPETADQKKDRLNSELKARSDHVKRLNRMANFWVGRIHARENQIAEKLEALVASVDDEGGGKAEAKGSEASPDAPQKSPSPPLGSLAAASLARVAAAAAETEGPSPQAEEKRRNSTGGGMMALSAIAKFKANVSRRKSDTQQDEKLRFELERARQEFAFLDAQPSTETKDERLSSKASSERSSSKAKSPSNTLNPNEPSKDKWANARRLSGLFLKKLSDAGAHVAFDDSALTPSSRYEPLGLKAIKIKLPPETPKGDSEPGLTPTFEDCSPALRTAFSKAMSSSNARKALLGGSSDVAESTNSKIEQKGWKGLLEAIQMANEKKMEASEGSAQKLTKNVNAAASKFLQAGKSKTLAIAEPQLPDTVVHDALQARKDSIRRRFPLVMQEGMSQSEHLPLDNFMIGAENSKKPSSWNGGFRGLMKSVQRMKLAAQKGNDEENREVNIPEAASRNRSAAQQKAQSRWTTIRNHSFANRKKRIFKGRRRSRIADVFDEFKQFMDTMHEHDEQSKKERPEKDDKASVAARFQSAKPFGQGSQRQTTLRMAQNARRHLLEIHGSEEDAYKAALAARGIATKLTRGALIQGLAATGVRSDELECLFKDVPGRHITRGMFKQCMWFAVEIDDLPELRRRLEQKYGTLQKAFVSATVSKQKALDLQDFCSLCLEVGAEAAKAQRLFGVLLGFNNGARSIAPTLSENDFVIGIRHAEAHEALHVMRTEYGLKEWSDRLSAEALTTPLTLQSFVDEMSSLGIPKSDALHVCKMLMAETPHSHTKPLTLGRMIPLLVHGKRLQEKKQRMNTLQPQASLKSLQTVTLSDDDDDDVNALNSLGGQPVVAGGVAVDDDDGFGDVSEDGSDDEAREEAKERGLNLLDKLAGVSMFRSTRNALQFFAHASIDPARMRTKDEFIAIMIATFGMQPQNGSDIFVVVSNGRTKASINDLISTLQNTRPLLTLAALKKKLLQIGARPYESQQAVSFKAWYEWLRSMDVRVKDASRMFLELDVEGAGRIRCEDLNKALNLSHMHSKGQQRALREFRRRLQRHRQATLRVLLEWPHDFLTQSQLWTVFQDAGLTTQDLRTCCSSVALHKSGNIHMPTLIQFLEKILSEDLNSVRELMMLEHKKSSEEKKASDEVDVNAPDNEAEEEEVEAEAEVEEAAEALQEEEQYSDEDEEEEEPKDDEDTPFSPYAIAAASGPLLPLRLESLGQLKPPAQAVASTGRGSAEQSPSSRAHANASAVQRLYAATLKAFAVACEGERGGAELLRTVKCARRLAVLLLGGLGDIPRRSWLDWWIAMRGSKLFEHQDWISSILDSVEDEHKESGVELAEVVKATARLVPKFGRRKLARSFGLVKLLYGRQQVGRIGPASFSAALHFASPASSLLALRNRLVCTFGSVAFAITAAREFYSVAFAIADARADEGAGEGGPAKPISRRFLKTWCFWTAGADDSDGGALRSLLGAVSFLSGCDANQLPENAGVWKHVEFALEHAHTFARLEGVRRQAVRLSGGCMQDGLSTLLGVSIAALEGEEEVAPLDAEAVARVLGLPKAADKAEEDAEADTMAWRRREIGSVIEVLQHGAPARAQRRRPHSGSTFSEGGESSSASACAAEAAGEVAEPTVALLHSCLASLAAEGGNDPLTLQLLRKRLPLESKRYRDAVMAWRSLLPALLKRFPGGADELWEYLDEGELGHLTLERWMSRFPRAVHVPRQRAQLMFGLLVDFGHSAFDENELPVRICHTDVARAWRLSSPPTSLVALHRTFVAEMGSVLLAFDSMSRGQSYIIYRRWIKSMRALWIFEKEAIRFLAMCSLGSDLGVSRFEFEKTMRFPQLAENLKSFTGKILNKYGSIAKAFEGMPLSKALDCADAQSFSACEYPVSEPEMPEIVGYLFPGCRLLQVRDILDALTGIEEQYCLLRLPLPDDEALSVLDSDPPEAAPLPELPPGAAPTSTTTSASRTAAWAARRWSTGSVGSQFSLESMRSGKRNSALPRLARNT